MKFNTASKLGLLILAVAITMTSCKKLDNLVNVNVGLQIAEVPFQIDTTDEVSPTVTSSKDTIQFNVDAAIKANNTSLSAANIKSAKVDSIVLVLTNGSFISSNVTVATASSHSDTFTSDVTFTGNTAGETATSLTFLPSGSVDLTSYLKSTEFYYSFSVTHGAIANPLQGKAIVYFHVEVAPN